MGKGIQENQNAGESKKQGEEILEDVKLGKTQK